MESGACGSNIIFKGFPALKTVVIWLLAQYAEPDFDLIELAATAPPSITSSPNSKHNKAAYEI